MATSILDLLLVIVVWVVVAVEAVVPIIAAVFIPAATATALNTACQFLQASFTNN